jgi:pimeloyl-ACP methyl ester carboxylesterase
VVEKREFRLLQAELNGLPVYTQISANSPPKAKAVVLIHGLGLSSTYLMPTAKALAPYYRVFVPDLPGFGRSGKPSHVADVPELANDLAAWMAVIELNRAVLLGNSFGCQIIVECAARHPERVEQAILQGPTTPPEERGWFWQFVRWRQNPNPNMGAISRRDYRSAGLGRVLKTFRYSLLHPMEDRLEQINVPVLVVRGSRDPICRHGWAEEVAQRLPQGQLVVIPGVHHTLVFTHPLELVRVCRPFLDGKGPLAQTSRAARPPQPTANAPKRPPLAQFDSASAMTRALGAYLNGRDFPALGPYPAWAEPALKAVGTVVNALPEPAKKQVYIWSGRREAIQPERLGAIRAEHLAQWAIKQYPRRPYPAAMIGSSNGALLHLCTALGIPWLPQTFLIPVQRSGIAPNQPKAELKWGKGPGSRLLAANPDLILHHMHDPNQDYLMIQRMSYFRVKLSRLVQIYQRFLAETLEPGATIFSVECNLCWPTVEIGKRHVFQTGALGGMPPEEYLRGSPRLTEFLQQQGSDPEQWDAPATDGERPEAEWGFEPTLCQDIEQFARDQGYRHIRIVFDHPKDPSPLVADFYRAWYQRRKFSANRLLMVNFILMEPYWTLRTGSVPFWTVFSVEHSAETLERYLEASRDYDEIYLMLFSHGVSSVGLAPTDQWRSILARAKKQGAFIGVDEVTYPKDFATFARYHSSLQHAIHARYPIPGPLSLRELDGFLDRVGDRYLVQWINDQNPH